MSDQPLRKLKKLTPVSEQNNPIRILYVEDAAVIRDTIARLLELKGFTVAYAQNGQEGVEMALRWKPDLILMDLRMPIMDGYQAISEIRINPQTRSLPIFVVSAWSSKRERTSAKVAGADQFFVKPPNLDQLITAINEAVAASRKSATD